MQCLTWILKRYILTTHIIVLSGLLKLFFLFQFVRPLENNLAIWKKTQKDKKDTAAAKKGEAVAKKKAETGENDDKKEEGEEVEEVVEEENKENDNNEENKDPAQ